MLLLLYTYSGQALMGSVMNDSNGDWPPVILLTTSCNLRLLSVPQTE